MARFHCTPSTSDPQPMLPVGGTGSPQLEGGNSPDIREEVKSRESPILPNSAQFCCLGGDRFILRRGGFREPKWRPAPIRRSRETG